MATTLDIIEICPRCKRCPIYRPQPGVASCYHCGGINGEDAGVVYDRRVEGIDVKYIAGLFDGEGSIGIYWNIGSQDDRYLSGKRSGGWIRTAAITACYLPTLKEIHSIYGGSLRPGSKATDTRKAKWKWALGAAQDIARFLTDLRPYLREKAEQADLMLKELRGEVTTEVAETELRVMKKESCEDQDV